MMPSTAIRIASASRIWIIVSSLSSAPVCCVDERAAVGHRHLGAVREQRLHLRLDVGHPRRPAASRMKPWIGCGMAKSFAAVAGSSAPGWSAARLVDAADRVACAARPGTAARSPSSRPTSRGTLAVSELTAIWSGPSRSMSPAVAVAPNDLGAARPMSLAAATHGALAVDHAPCRRTRRGQRARPGSACALSSTAGSNVGGRGPLCSPVITSSALMVSCGQRAEAALRRVQDHRRRR